MIVGYGVLAALVVSVNVDLLIGALTGTFVGLAVFAGLLAAAVATGTHGLARLLGPVGLAVAVGLFLIVGLPSSGGAVTHELQPGFYGAVSQWLPPGAALVALRDVVYFDWSGAAQPLLALGAWIVAGFSLAAVAERRGRRGSGDDAETSVAISEDMRDIVDRTMLGFVATVCEDGSPNVSPKGSIRVYDDHHLVFVDTASPGTVGNLRRDPRVEVSCVDFLRRRGYRFKGRGEVLDPGDPVHIWVHRWLLETHGPAIPAHHAVKISVEQVRPTHMRAAYIERFGSPDVIRVGELSEPTPGPRQVLVRVAAVAVNHVDALIREGTWRTPLSFPFVIGRDLVGSVVEVGSLVDEFAPGQRVWADSLGYGGRQGALAEYAVVDAERLYQLPEGLDPVGSVACFHPALTAHLGLMRELGGVGPGDTVFVNGGSGAVGNAVIQLAVAAGARVFATASTSDGEERCRAAGATVLPGDEPGLGVDVCWDAHGSNDLAHATETLAPGGAPTSFPLRAEAERLNGG